MVSIILDMPSSFRHCKLRAGAGRGLSTAFKGASGEAELATKQDIRGLELKINTRFERVDGEFQFSRRMLGIIIIAEVTPLPAKLFH